MKLMLTTTRRKAVSPWRLCHGCCGIIVKHVSTSSGASFRPKKYTSPSAASLELRNSGPARTRFAPSPTGYLHLGSLRTALFNYLVAKSTGGQFLLRIEDTDQKRTVHDAEQRLFQDLEWAGVEWDEGPKVGGPYGPYKQSQRLAIYREHVDQLLRSGNAYRCFCTPQRLRNLADYRSKLGLPPDYDRTCTHLSKEESDDREAHGEAHVVRLLAPDQMPAFNDIVYGLVRQRKGSSITPRANLGAVNGSLGSYEDPVLMKSDGFPTYHLANVVDDHLMKITHVIRGSEWMSSTPKHLVMYEAFGWEPPKFAHVGLLLDKDRQKLSKRQASVGISDLRKRGIFPEALTNFVALLGWSHNVGNDVMNLESLISNASLKFTRGDTIVDFGKLAYLQKQHALRYASSPSSSNPLHDLNNLAVQPTLKLLEKSCTDYPGRYAFYQTLPSAAHQNYVRDILWADAKQYIDPIDFIERNTYFWVAPAPESLMETMPALRLHNVPNIASQPSPLALTPFFASFSEIPEEDWNTTEIKSWINSIIEQATSRSFVELAYKNKHWSEEDVVSARKQWGKSWNKLVYQYLRWALMGGKHGPDLAETVRILGRDETIRRLNVARDTPLVRAEGEKGHKTEASVTSAAAIGPILSKTLGSASAASTDASSGTEANLPVAHKASGRGVEERDALKR